MIFRIARHTNNLDEIKVFYTEVIGLNFLGKFENHNNYNGIFLGKEGLDWHLEFTESKDKVVHVFDDDDCLVFYPSTKQEYDEVTTRINLNKIEKISAKNPYWNTNGIIISDPDGCQIIISPQKIIE
jgi:YycE-like N-terminal domain/YycE-like C-terminal domain